MNGLLLLLLDAIHDRWGDIKIIIHCGYEVDGHAKDSQHKLGNAADFHIASSLSLPEQSDRLEMILKELQVFNKIGFGLYPNWDSPGFHLDVRGVYARWGRIGKTYVGYGDALEHAKRQVVEKINA